jgi:hypothetical protein
VLAHKTPTARAAHQRAAVKQHSSISGNLGLAEDVIVGCIGRPGLGSLRDEGDSARIQGKNLGPQELIRASLPQRTREPYTQTVIGRRESGVLSPTANSGQDSQHEDSSFKTHPAVIARAMLVLNWCEFVFIRG